MEQEGYLRYPIPGQISNRSRCQDQHGDKLNSRSSISIISHCRRHKHSTASWPFLRIAPRLALGNFVSTHY